MLRLPAVDLDDLNGACVDLTVLEPGDRVTGF
jgi:hypothetical protein